jgi:SAM-dependent methyltransferase
MIEVIGKVLRPGSGSGQPMSNVSHDQELSAAFDGQAARFEKAPVQSDPQALARLVRFAELPHGAMVLDAGCGPGLVAEAFLKAGFSVFGIDLSAEMVERARRRCAPFGARARFVQGSVFDTIDAGPFDAAVSRFVLHHAADPLAFLRRQAELLRPGGILVACDHTTDPDPVRASWHRDIERGRDHTHTRNLTAGEIVDLFAQAGLGEVRMIEEPFTLDFDEWFDRGTPAISKDEARGRLLAFSARGFTPSLNPDGSVTIASWRALVRGVKPAS